MIADLNLNIYTCMPGIGKNTSYALFSFNHKNAYVRITHSSFSSCRIRTAFVNVNDVFHRFYVEQWPLQEKFEYTE